MSEKVRVTLRDIAHHANVSVSTVSRALNDHEYVNDATRQVVQQAAASLGYPLTNLRTAPLAAPTVVTLISPNYEEIPTSHNDFDFLASEGVRAELGARSLQISFARLISDGSNWLELANRSGVIWLGGIVNRDFVKALQQHGTPFVLLGGHALPLAANTIMANYAYGIAQAVDHLVMRGRRHIGLINGPLSTATSSERWHSFCASLVRHDLPFSAAQVLDGTFEASDGYNQTWRLLKQYPALDAIIYSHDITAMGGMTALKENGCRIPDDVAVVGCHNYEISRFTDPALTTIGFDMREMGRMAVRRLQEIINGDQSCWTILAQTELIVRHST